MNFDTVFDLMALKLELIMPYSVWMPFDLFADPVQFENLFITHMTSVRSTWLENPKWNVWLLAFDSIEQHEVEKKNSALYAKIYPSFICMPFRAHANSVEIIFALQLH